MENLVELEINLENLSQNIKNLKGLLKQETLFMAVVKANAYGHGMTEVSYAAIQAGADWLAVTNIDEAIELREAKIHKPILILGEVLNDDLRTAANKDISVALISLEKIREVSDINFDKPLKVHLKIDTGLNRLGIELAEIPEAVRILKSHRNIIIEGVFSHLASVEKENFDYAKTQVKNFKEAIKILQQNGVQDIIRHLAATAATLLLPDSQFDMVRCGLGIYGLWPSEEIKKSFDHSDFLSPVLEFKTQIVQTKKVSEGEKIGYGCSFEAKNYMKIAIIPIGYYDGFDRELSNRGAVLISGIKCPVVGRVCMSMSIIDISKLISQNSKVGDEVVIIGKQGNAEITVDDLTEKLNTNNYEIVTRLPAHLPRVFIG